MAEVWRFFAHEDDFADLDEAGACERLGRVLSFPTISSMDAQTVDWQAFADLRAYMQQAWPRVFAAGEVELIDHSLLVTLAGTDPALKPVMLMGHMDVVPVVPGTQTDWTYDPFSGHVDDTYIWGRGAIDMKDQVAGILEAVEYALAHGWQHERTLLLAFGQDEETTQYGAGAIGRALEERGVELEYLIDEGDYRIVSAAEYGAGAGWLMHADLAEKGYADIVLKTKSEGGHSSNPYGGTSLEVLSRAIAAICDIEWPTRVTDLLAAQLVELGLYTADEIAASKDAIVRDCPRQQKAVPACNHHLRAHANRRRQYRCQRNAAGYVGQYQLPHARGHERGRCRGLLPRGRCHRWARWPSRGRAGPRQLRALAVPARGRSGARGRSRHRRPLFP